MDHLRGAPATELFGRCAGAKVTSVEHTPTDRSLAIDLDDGRGELARIVIRLFGPRGDVSLEREGAVLESTGPSRSQRRARPEQAVPPPFHDLDSGLLAEAFAGRVRPAGLPEALLERFRGSDGTPLLDDLLSFRDGVNEGRTPFYLAAQGNPAESFPFPDPGEGRPGPFTDAMEAAVALGNILLAGQMNLIVSRLAKPLRSLLERKSRLIERLERDRERAVRYGEVRREAEAAAAYQSLIKPGTSVAELPDPYDQSKRVEIRLDPSKRIQEQIDARFKLAAKLERSIRKIDARIADTRATIEEVRSVLAEIEAAPLEEACKLAGRAAERFGTHEPAASKPRGQAAKRYKSYDLDEDWFVLVGRSNKDNDELTFGRASPGDYWLHAQDVPGSHVILKSRRTAGNPPATILEKAAAVAAYHSRARHSSIVPVVCTQRRYVRKPRKAPPGTVTCTRAKTIFARPSLPEKEEGEA